MNDFIYNVTQFNVTDTANLKRYGVRAGGPFKVWSEVTPSGGDILYVDIGYEADLDQLILDLNRLKELILEGRDHK